MAPDTVDKRQGSIIYDTLAVSDVQLAKAYIELKRYYYNSFALTAEGEYLDYRVAEAGLERHNVTPAVKRAQFTTANGQPAVVPLGARFSTSSDSKALIYEVTSICTEDNMAVPGSYLLTCETAGTCGNDYVGELIPVTYINRLAQSTMGELQIPGSDTEADADLRLRYLEAVKRPAFGGNVAQYRQWVLDMAGVGAVQVYPVWAGGGTVKISIVDAGYHPATPILVQRVQDALDPDVNKGLGLGLAPIGHTVTVDTPERMDIQISAELRLAMDMELVNVQDAVEQAIEEYLSTLRRQFGESGDSNTYMLDVYRARVVSAILQVVGVQNVTHLLLDGMDADIHLQEGPQVQQLPYCGNVTLSRIV